MNGVCSTRQTSFQKDIMWYKKDLSQRAFSTQHIHICVNGVIWSRDASLRSELYCSTTQLLLKNTLRHSKHLLSNSFCVCVCVYIWPQSRVKCGDH